MEDKEREKEKSTASSVKPDATKDTNPTATEAADNSATVTTTKPKRVSSSRRRMQQELDRMREADENARARQKAEKKSQVKKAIAAMYEEKRKKGVTLTPDVEESREAVRSMMRLEERMALEKDLKKLKKETETIKAEIDAKYGISELPQGQELIKLAEEFYHGGNRDKDGLTDDVRKQLTQDEIRDLKMVFDMFDVKGRGYITAGDVKRAAGMLGFVAKKEVFKEMIEEVTGGKTSRITFLNFLKFVIKGQGSGPDPFEDIMQAFRLLDVDKKGYVTAADIRAASDEQKLSFSNRAIREMIQEADLTGDSKITPEEFVHTMLQCSMFKSYR